jgi:subtilisin family serine protease
VDAGGRLAVTVNAKNVRLATAALRKIGFEPTTTRPDLHFVEGTIAASSLGRVTEVPKRVGRFAIRPTYGPVTLAGSVTSQADLVMEGVRARGTVPVGFDGAGQRVGVLSDSFNVKGGAAADVASGDLPAAGVNVLAEGAASNTDEGRAMLQLVHDIAPGASLAFATANGGEATFAANIRRLADPADPSGFGGATIIVDDIAYPTEPMFQDGPIAQAIDDVVTNRGVAYFSAAGNFGGRAYESTIFQTAADFFSDVAGSTVNGVFYDFDPDLAAADTRQQITVPAGARFFINLQWDDPWYTASGVDTELDVFFVNPATNRVVATADRNNLQAQEPSELLSYTNSTGAPQSFDLLIRRSTSAATEPGRLKYVNYGSATVSIDEWTTNGPTVTPHAATANGQGIGAVPYYAQQTPETTSSPGPATILFSDSGVRLGSPQFRHSPQMAGVSGVDNTFFGTDLSLENSGTGNGKPNFSGTSAAAAHVAGVAALLRQANPAFTPSQVYARLQDTADDVASPGFDAVSGFGLVNAYDALYPAISVAADGYADGFEDGVLSSAYETRSTGPGRIQVTGVNGPFAGAKHLTLDSSLGGAGQSGLNEVTLHVDLSGAGTKLLSFREREFADDDHAMPPVFTGSADADGVALSVDGVNWVCVVSLTGSASTSSYQSHTFDLSAVAAAHGLALGADTRIRFQQFGQFEISGNPNGQDGIALADVMIASLPAWLSATPGAVAWDPGSKSLTVTGAATIVADPGSDAPAVTVSGASAVLTIDPVGGGGDTVVNLASLALVNGGRAVMSGHGAGAAARALVISGGNPVIDADSLLDLADNVLVLKNGTLAGVRAAIAAGFQRGGWLGTGGITSSAAANDPSGQTALGYADNASFAKNTFAGVSGLGANDVIVKYTYYGDADLSGAVTLDDFTLFLNGYQSLTPAASEWMLGDFDYSAATTLDDFTLFLSGYQRQSGPL